MTPYHAEPTDLVSTAEQAEPSSNGWERLLPLLNPGVVNAALDVTIWTRLDAELVGFLAHSVSKSPWLNHLALAAMIYASDGALQPAGPIHVMQRFLRWAIPQHYPDVNALNPEAALVAYFGDPPQACGWSATKAYNALQLHVQGYLKDWSPAQQEALAPFLFPTLVYTPRLKQLNKAAVENSMTGRKEQAFAVVAHLPELVVLARKRYKWLAELEAQVHAIKQLAAKGEATLPVIIEVPALSGEGMLTFRLWDRISWIKAHPADYSRSALKCAKFTKRRKNRQPAPQQCFLQFIGDLPEQAWFLRAIALNVLQGPVAHTSAITEYLRTWKVPAFGRKRHAGLLTPGPMMANILRFARRIRSAQDHPPVVFCVEPLLTAAAVGLLSLVSIVSTGMRVGELLQVTLDHHCMVYDAFPQFDDQTQHWQPGTQQLYWMLYPKGRERRERYLVTSAMYEALFIFLDLYQRYHGAGILPIRPHSKRAFKHARHFPGKHRFVFQWAGRQIEPGHINQCIAFLLLEHPCRNEQGKPVNITSHILRHGVAGWLHEQGIPLDEIMLLLKHVNLTVTQYYSRLSPEALHTKLGPALSALAKLAETKPETVRTVGDIQALAQTALKRYGVLRQTPGGVCAVFVPCEVQFKCATCPYFIPDPARQTEVQDKIASHARAVQLFVDEGDYLQADVQRAQQRAWKRIEQEMVALAEVELVSPPASMMLKLIGTEDLGEGFLHDLNHSQILPSKGTVLHD